MFILGVIPARAGSKSIEHKNMVDLGGMPLIEHTIKAAIPSNLDALVVSTDDTLLASYVFDKYKVELVCRPKELATDTTPMPPVLVHAVEEYEKNHGVTVDAVCILQPTSPFRTTETINECIKWFQKGYYNTVFTAHLGVHPMKLYFSKTKVPVMQKMHKKPYDKNQKQVLERDGCVFIVDKQTISVGKVVGNTKRIVEISKIEGLDIDYPDDLLIARAVYNMKTT